jgi:dihydrofolate reductase
MISLIACKDRNGILGNKGKLPWNLPGYTEKLFQALTGKNVIAGYKSYSLFNKQRLFDLTDEVWCDDERTLKAVLAIPEDYVVIGGANTFEKYIHHAEEMHITTLLKEYTGDCYFPEIDFGMWTVASKKKAAFEDPKKNEIVKAEVIHYVRRST